MRYPTVFLLLACAAAPAAAQNAPAKVSIPPAAQERHTPAKPSEAAKAADDFDMGKLMQVFDKIFPAQPAPPPERLALARATAAGVLPDGTYAAMIDELMSGLVERVLSIDPAEFAGAKPDPKATKTSLRDAIARDDPHFEERMRITRRVVGEELVKISALIEPRLRDGLARSIARRFDEAQLREINAFLATDSGRAFGSQTMRMWMDPDVMRSMIQSFPEMMTAMPGAMKRLEAETAHLPKPKKKQAAEPKEPDESEGEDEDSGEG